jgi:hypothetical protein
MPHAVINATCPNYLAESFMASHLFSLASGGAVFNCDPYCVVSNDQFNAGGYRGESFSSNVPQILSSGFSICV